MFVSILHFANRPFGCFEPLSGGTEVCFLAEESGYVRAGRLCLQLVSQETVVVPAPRLSNDRDEIHARSVDPQPSGRARGHGGNRAAGGRATAGHADA